MSHFFQLNFLIVSVNYNKLEFSGAPGAYFATKAPKTFALYVTFPSKVVGTEIIKALCPGLIRNDVTTAFLSAFLTD